MIGDLNGKSITAVLMSAPPTTGEWTWGDWILNTMPVAGGSMGWVCTNSGFATGTAWSSGTLFENDEQVSNSGHVYQCIKAGVSGTNGPSGTLSTPIADGECEWVYVGPLATFYQFGLISTT